MALFRKSHLEKGLLKIVGPSGLLSSREDRLCYGFDSSGLEQEPSLVVLPDDPLQVKKVIRLCSRLDVPITPRGAGSGTTGAAVPVSGGVVLCLLRMNRIFEIDPVEMMARVQPGVVTGVLQKEVEKQGLFYPPDPASLNFCTIGGNIATGAGGARAVKYGVTRDYVRGLKVVLADGSMIETGSATAKGVVGYDLTNLFVGSEGTLGIVVEAVLKLLPRPVAYGTVAAFFERIDHAVDSVTCLFKSGLLPSCAEFLDEKTLKAVGAELPMEVPPDARAFLLVEVDGDEASVKKGLGLLTACLKKEKAISFFEASTFRERQKLWQVRRGVSPALKRLGFERKISEDICVPRKAIKEMLLFLKGLEEHFPINIFSFGHVGDGNIHVNLLLNPDEVSEEDTSSLIKAIMKKSVELEGTISGEHGIGISKMPYMGIELSSKVIELEKDIKKVFDPKGILNPGKIFEG